jgi:Fic family protein
MLEIAIIQSTGASNRIEGIYTSDEHLDALVKLKAEPRNRSEREIAGYREVLRLIHESYDYIVPRTNVILRLHRDLYQFSPSSTGGKYKNSDNLITETDAFGQSKIRFKPLTDFEISEAVDCLTNTFIDAINADKYDPLLLIPMFVLDFLCIHPFNDGNGRMSRLLTLLLLYRSGYIVGKYISIEMIIEKTKETYYEVLQDSSAEWH